MFLVALFFMFDLDSDSVSLIASYLSEPSVTLFCYVFCFLIGSSVQVFSLLISCSDEILSFVLLSSLDVLV